jgi:hypothetical protein
MRHQSGFVTLVFGALALGACSDATIGESVTGMPSLNSGQGTTHCDGTLPPGVYANVVVLPDANCTMSNVTVLRDVQVEPRGFLAMSNYQIGNDVEGHNAGQIIMQSGSVGNDIRIKGGAEGFVGASIQNTVVGGDITVEKLETGLIFIVLNQVPNGRIYVADNTTTFFLQIAANTVGQTIDVFRNDGPSPKVVDSNTAGVAVRCEDNSQPFVGGPNAAPSREGQCF